MNPNKCSINSLFNDISKMWVLPILYNIYMGKSTFSSIKNSVGKISSKTLSERLKELQANEFIKRTIISEQPLKIEYSMTEKGESFMKKICPLNTWAQEWGY